MDRQSLKKRAAKEIEQMEGKMREAIEKTREQTRGESQETHAQDYQKIQSLEQKIQSLELDRRESETKTKVLEATIKDLRKQEQAAKITKAKKTINKPNNVIKRVPKRWFNELYKNK